jgi:hypothetical protein
VIHSRHAGFRLTAHRHQLLPNALRRKCLLFRRQIETVEKVWGPAGGKRPGW